MSDVDFIVALGRPFLAHRLRRASETILDGTAPFLREHGFDAPPRSVSTVLLLQGEGSLSVTEIARRLGLTHPRVIQLVRALIGAGYVSESADAGDGRRRMLKLTPAGERQADALRSLISATADAFEGLFEDMEADLYEAVKRFEAATAEQSVRDRLERALDRKRGNAVSEARP